MAADEEILKRLDLIQGTLALAFASQLDEAKTKIRADDVSAAILDLTEDWIGTTKLQNDVAKKLSKSTRSVRNRLPELVDQRVLQTRGTGTALEYRKTGLI
jgi:DNA-binding Lrp family transcriptional regulator